MPEYDVEIYADFGEGDHVAWIDRSDMKNGTIRVSPNVADEDDTVSIYVTPDTGYQLDELIVEDEDGHDVTTSSLASGTRYTFRMPDSDVTVTATFKSRSYSSNFTDVPRYEWYYEAVSYVASEVASGRRTQRPHRRLHGRARGAVLLHRRGLGLPPGHRHRRGQQPL